MTIFYSTIVCGIRENTEFIIQKHFTKNVSLEFSKVKIPPLVKKEIETKVKQSFFRENVYCWFITEQDSLISIALLDNTLGKAMPITFLVIFDLLGDIQHTQIIKYREAIGGEIQSEVWNSQFRGFNRTSQFDKIDGISGATISVHSVSKGIQKLVLLFPSILENYESESHE